VIGWLGAGHKPDSVVSRLDARAKLLATGGYVGAVLLAPVRPLWAAAALAALLVVAAAMGRITIRTAGMRLLALALIIGAPFALSRLGSDETRHAGEIFAVKSALIAAAFLVLTATTRTEDMLDAMAQTPLLSGLSGLAALMLRGAHVLIGEVIRTNRAWALRAPGASWMTKVHGLGVASISLLGRAAVRSERIGAAMVLRGFTGSLPAAELGRPRLRDVAVASVFATICLAIGVTARWG